MRFFNMKNTELTASEISSGAFLSLASEKKEYMKKQKLYYGWVVAVCCMLSVCGSSLLSTGMSTNLNAMRQCLGLSHTQTAMILTVRSISAFVAAMFSVQYFDHLGIKRGMTLAMLIGAISFLIFVFAGSNMFFNYTGAALAGICYSYGMMMPVSMLLKNWFNKSRGTALSIASCGTGLVSIVFAPLIQTIVDKNGIRAAFLMQAATVLFIMFIVLVFIAERPEDKGMCPYGGSDYVTEQNKEREHFTKSLSVRWYYGLIFATALIGMSASPCSANYTNNLVTAGLDSMEAARALSFYGVVLILSKMILGRLIDKAGTKLTTVIFGVLCTAGMFMLVLVNRYPTVPFMYLSMIMIGIGVPIQTLGYPNWVAELDSEHYNHTLEKCQMGYQLGCVAGSPIPGILADITGNYGAAYFMFTLCTVIAVIIVSGAFISQEKKKR